MPTTVFLSVRGDGAWRMLESFKRALGPEAESLVVQANRDDSGFYGSADVGDPASARDAFLDARKPFPALKAYLGAVRPEREEPTRPPASARGAEAKGRGGDGRAGDSRTRDRERPRAQEALRDKERTPDRDKEASRGPRRSPLRHRNRNERRPPALS